MYFESRLQKYCRTGRVVSLLIGRAALKGSPAFFTQMLRVPLYGFKNERYCPSGDICAPPIWISPKKAARSIIGGCSPTAAPAPNTPKTATTAKTNFLIGRPPDAKLKLAFEDYSCGRRSPKHPVTKRPYCYVWNALRRAHETFFLSAYASEDLRLPGFGSPYQVPIRRTRPQLNLNAFRYWRPFIGASHVCS